MTTTDHKVIGNLYFITSFVWFLLGGAHGARHPRRADRSPGMQVVDNPDQYNQLFTMHGTIMLLLFATPLFAGFANALMPLQIGAPDVSFPRLNMFAYWLYLFGGLIAAGGFLTPGGAAAFGWFAYTPLSDASYSPGMGGDLWVFGLALSGFGTILGSVNFITTILTMRAPGMTMFRMPIFAWTVLVTSILVLLIFPALAAALFALGADRRFGAHIFDPDSGGVMLWQHVFWFFGHPEVYVIALPFFGIISEILPVFSRKPIFGYKTLVYATIAIAALSVSVWAHHMYGTGQVLLPFFAIMTMLIAVPTGVKFFNWIGTMWGGKLTFDTPMLWAHRLPRDLPLRWSHRRHPRQPGARLPPHRQLLRRGALPLRRLRHRRLRDVRWLLLLVAQAHRSDARRDAGQDPLLDAVRRLPHDLPHPAPAGHLGHAASLRRLPARGRLHLRQPGLVTAAPSSSVPRCCPFFYNVWKTWRYAPLVETDDPWGYGASLEWATSCPPPRHNFNSIPRIRSERPAFDLQPPRGRTRRLRALRTRQGPGTG